MTERSDRMFGEQPEWDGPAETGEPGFIAEKRDPDTFDDTQKDWELHKQVLESVKEMSEDAAKASRPTEAPPQARHFKVGETDLDAFPTDPSGFSIGRPLTREEMTTIDERLKTQWKDLPRREQEKNIREYLQIKERLKNTD